MRRCFADLLAHPPAAQPPRWTRQETRIQSIIEHIA